MTSPAQGRTPPGVPPAEFEVDERLVTALLADQHPDLAPLPLQHVATGWDNVTFRLGGDLAVRVPRIAAAAPLIRREQEWLARLAPALPVPVPAPVRAGVPGAGFPWPWSVVPWVPGRSAERAPLDPAEAPTVGDFLAALHATPTEGAPRNSWRGIPPAQVEPDVGERLAQVADAVPGGAEGHRRLQDLWARALAAPVDVPPALVHADLHPKNLVVRDGRLAAVLDWGDITLGDPAIDLAAAWMLLPPSAHPAMRAAYGEVSEATDARAQGWAVFFAVQLLTAGLAGDAAFLAAGRTTMERLLPA